MFNSIPHTASSTSGSGPANAYGSERDGNADVPPADKGQKDMEGFTASPPTCMADATTRSSLMESHQDEARWVYYRGPVQDCLRRMGCPAQDLDDLTHDLLIRLQTNILLGYDRRRPFRPYLRQAIRNWYLGRLRRRKDVERQVPLPDLDGELATGELEEGLVDYARQGYHIFALEADESMRMGIAMLEAWIIDDVDQLTLAKHWKLTDRQVRTWLARTAERLAAWMHGHLHPQDLTTLVARADRQGRPVALNPQGLRQLFSHLSQQKRANALLILSLIVRRDRTSAGKPPQS